MKKIYAIIGTCIIIAAIAIGSVIILRQTPTQPPNASANNNEPHNPIVKIYDSTFTTETDYFTTCPVTVGIKTYSAVGPYDVILVKPDDTEITLATGVVAGVWHSFTPTCDQTGWWRAKAGSATIPFGIGTFFVIFEVPLGVATALAACFAGFGVKQIRGRRKQTL